MSKRPSLFASSPITAADSAGTEEQRPAPPAEFTKRTLRPPSREGKRVVSTYLEPEAWKQLRLLSLNSERSTQALGEEAFNLLFEKYQLNWIA